MEAYVADATCSRVEPLIMISMIETTPPLALRIAPEFFFEGRAVFGKCLL